MTFHVYSPFNYSISDLAYYCSRCGLSEPDFIHELRDALRKVPFSLRNTQTASTFIRILGSELLDSTTTTCTRFVSSQGFQLCNVLSSTLLLRELTRDEINMVYNLAMRRLERSVCWFSLSLIVDLIYI